MLNATTERNHLANCQLGNFFIMRNFCACLLLLAYFKIAVSAEEFDGRATCNPNTCIANFVREKLWDIQRRLIDEGNDTLAYLPEHTINGKSVVSDLDVRFRNGISRGFLSNMNLLSPSVHSNVLYGTIQVHINSGGINIEGDYTAQGNVLNTTVQSSGRTQLSHGAYMYFYVYYNVTNTGLINVLTRETVYSTLYPPTYKTASFENFLERQDPLWPLLSVYLGTSITNVKRDEANLVWRKFLQYFKESLQDIPLDTITSWARVPTVPPTTQRPTTVIPPTTTLPPYYPCYPDDCIKTYITKHMASLESYAVNAGFEKLPLNRTFFNRTLTTVFDLDLTYGNATVEKLLTNLQSVSSFSSNLIGGTMSFYNTVKSIFISGTYKGNGTVLGEDLDTQGTWSGNLDVTIVYSFSYNISTDGRVSVISSTSRVFSWKQFYNFQTDMFQSLHPLKEPFDSLVGTQLSRAFAPWLADLGHYVSQYVKEGLNALEFLQLITELQQLPTQPTLAPTVPTTTSPSPFECSPDECLLDYVKQKFSRFPDWVDIDGRDPLILPDRYNVSFTNSIWNLALTLTDINVHGYLPTFLNARTTMVSDCLSGTITINTYSPYLQLQGNYISSGSLAEHSLDNAGQWNMALQVYSSLVMNYRIDSQGVISELRSLFRTSQQAKTNVTFIDLVQPDVPLADLLISDIGNRASTLVSNEIRTFTPLISDFMDVLLTENKFLDIITWHRYGNETTDPPVVCPDRTRSSVQISNWYFPVFGHVPMIIKGSRLDMLQKLECRFSDFADIFVEGKVLDYTTASCEIPYLYNVGWIEVEIVLQFANGCEQRYQQSIYAAKPQDISNTIKASLSEDGLFSLNWNSNYFNATELQLSFVELDRRGWQWIPRGVLIASLPNSGNYSGPVDDVSNLIQISSGFAVYLSIKDANVVKHMYSDVLYTKYEKTQDYFRQQCNSFLQQDNGPPTNLEPCPPLLSQAWLDSRFEFNWYLQDKEIIDFYHPGGELSFRQVIPNNQGAGSECVYKNDSIYVGGLGGGSADYSSPNNRSGFIGHHINDIYPWYVCCKYSNDEGLCRNYYVKRPSDAGLDYIPPRPGNGEGDPHISTFDGVSYTFNGVGEFWMVQPSSSFDFGGRSTKLALQARMERFKDTATNTFTNASSFTAFAIREWNATAVTISVQVSISGNQLEILADQKRLSIPEEYVPQSKKPFITNFPDGTAFSLLVNAESEVKSAVISFNAGFSFNISLIPGQNALNIISSVDEALSEKGYNGLLGLYDGVLDNDLTYPGGVAVPVVNATLQQIHEDFGLKWRTSKNNSVFYYDSWEAHEDFQDVDFVPTFEEPRLEDYPEVADVCGTSKECLFDYVSTGSVEFAKETKQFEEEFKEVEKTLAEEVVMCKDSLTAPENGDFQVENYIVGAVAKFLCDPEYILKGQKELTCTAEGKWDSVEPTCVEKSDDFDCSGRADGYYGNPLDCSKYIGCLRGSLYEYTCPAPMLFDSVKLFCVHPLLAQCTV